MKALEILKDYYHDIVYFIGSDQLMEAIFELEALQQPKSCKLEQSNGTQLNIVPEFIWNDGHYYKLVAKEQ